MVVEEERDLETIDIHVNVGHIPAGYERLAGPAEGGGEEGKE